MTEISPQGQPVVHAFVATPAYDGKVDTGYSQSLAQACQAATVFGIRVTACVMGNGAFIDLARNMFVKMFLKEPDYTHLFFIDSDLEFDPHAFVNLIRANRPVVAGVYRRRQEPEDYPCWWTPHPEISKEKGTDCLWVEDDNWLQCHRVPTGFLCIERKVIEEMAQDARRLQIAGQEGRVPELFYTRIDEEDRFVGEDFCWCDDYVKKYGRQIDVLADLDFTHGGFKGNYAKWLSKKAEVFGKDNEVAKNPNKRLGDRRRAG